ncbi:hypothetical protein GF420_15740 [candidate division GN15 bacterium]|nr:hypothetical protein [candidate division GN15 bacterium]
MTKWVRLGEAAILRSLQMEIVKWGNENKEQIAKSSPEEKKVLQDVLNLLEAGIKSQHRPYKLKFLLNGRNKPILFSFSKNVERVCREYGFPTQQGIEFVERLCEERFGVAHPFKVSKEAQTVKIQEKHDSVPRTIEWNAGHFECISK